MYSREEEKEVRKEFWRKLDSRTRRLPGQKGKKRKWIFENTGVKGLDLRFEAGRQFMRVALEVNHRQESVRLDLYEKLEACKSIIEENHGGELIWDLAFTKDNGQEVCRIYSEMSGDINRQNEWPVYFRFLIDNMIRLEAAFIEVKDFLEHKEFKP